MSTWIWIVIVVAAALVGAGVALWVISSAITKAIGRGLGW